MADSNLKVGALEAAPGQKMAKNQAVTVANQTLDLPFFLVNGSEPGPTLAVTGGIHGAEYASIQAALELGRTIEPRDLRGRLIIAPVVTVPSFKARSIYVNPLDGKNINRVFPGDPNGSASEQLAYWIFTNVMQPADYYIDLHGGDLNEALVPFSIYYQSGDAELDKRSLELARVFAIPNIVRSEVPGSTYAAASRAGKPAILAESGGQGVWRIEDIAFHTIGLNRVLKHLGMLQGPPVEPRPTRLMDQFAWLRSDFDGYWYPQVRVGASVVRDEMLGSVTNFQGNVLQRVTAPVSGAILFLVSSLAMNQGDPLLAIGASSE